MLILAFIAGLVILAMYSNLTGNIQITTDLFVFESSLFIFALGAVCAIIALYFALQFIEYLIGFRARFSKYMQAKKIAKGQTLLEDAYSLYCYKIYDDALSKSKEAFKIIPENNFCRLLYSKILIKANKLPDALEILTQKDSPLFDYMLLENFSEYQKNRGFLLELYSKFPKSTFIKKKIHQYNYAQSSQTSWYPIEEIYKKEQKLYAEFLWMQFDRSQKFNDAYDAWKASPKNFHFAHTLIQNITSKKKGLKYLDSIFYYLDEPILLEEFFKSQKINDPVERFNIATKVSNNKNYLAYLAHNAELTGIENDLGNSKEVSLNYYYQCTACCATQASWSPFCTSCNAHELEFKKVKSHALV